jgi:peptide/nickel transport system permease protein
LARLQFLRALLLVWAVVTIVFVVTYLLPGDPARIILGPRAPEEALAAFRHNAGLDLPLLVQYQRYLARVATLDFGWSYSYARPVFNLLAERGQASLRLAGIAFAITLLIGISVPLVLHSRQMRRALVHTIHVAQLIAFIPPYVLATLAIIVFASWLGLTPVLFGGGSPGSWLVPAFVLSAYPTAVVINVFANRLQHELLSDYAKRARSNGFSHSYVVWAEAFPNALPATIAALANGMAFFLTGTLFIEIIFGIPGLGNLAFDALRSKDVVVLAGICLSYSGFVIAMSTSLDGALHQMPPHNRVRGRSFA